MVVRIIKKDDDVVTAADLIDDIKKSKKVDEAGAIFTFEGIVRGKEPGKKVDKLILKTPDIEKAEKEMNEIAEDIKTKFGVFEVNIIHYIGEFYTGDSLFIVAILGPHRQKSYEALIDTIERVKFDIDFEKEEISNQGSKTILAGG
ncbi:MAG: molybdenum cofactor biosynthesis protein MoaE [Methanobrevibacter sp.]